MCNTANYSGCCCQPVNMHHGSGHHMGSTPNFPSKQEQIDILKRYRQKLKQELEDVEEKIKDLG